MQHLKSIHYLRAIAAIMVVVFHIFSNVEFMHPDLDKVNWLRGGVDIFFVISGYVMVKSTKDRDISPTHFIAQRAKRIIPIYWIATLATMMSIDGQNYFKVMSFLFIPAMNPETHVIQPVLAPGWSLNYEMFFYAIFAMSLFSRQIYRFSIMAISLASLVLIGLLFEGSDIFDFYTSSIIIEFLFGMALAQFGVKLPVLAFPVGFILMFAMQPLALERVFSMGLPATLIVAGAIAAEKHMPDWEIAHLLGSASYSIYLFHLLALGFMVAISPYLGLNHQAFIGVSLVFILASGCAFYWALERPIIAYFASVKIAKTGFRTAKEA